MSLLTSSVLAMGLRSWVAEAHGEVIAPHIDELLIT
jgi:hypothetical protein